jgi:hypothetical protein
MKSSPSRRETDAADKIISRAVQIWKKAQVVHQEPSWDGRPESRAIAEEIARSHPECEQKLVELLVDNHQLVVAYALFTLEIMRSAALQNLPPELLERRSNIKLMTGSIANAMDLGGLARQIQKRAREFPNR